MATSHKYPTNPYLHETLEGLVRDYSGEDVREALATVLAEVEGREVEWITRAEAAEVVRSLKYMSGGFCDIVAAAAAELMKGGEHK